MAEPGGDIPLHATPFASLAAAWPNAASLPLVLLRDRVDGRAAPFGYCHLDFFSLYVVRQGRGTHWIDAVPYSVARGDVYAMGLGQAHWFTDSANLTLDTLHFAPSVFDPPALDALAQTPGFQSLFVEEPLRRPETSGEGGRWLHLTPEQHAQTDAQITELRAEWSAGTPDGALLTRGLFLRLLVSLARYYAQRPSGPSGPLAHDTTVAAAVRYMEAHFAGPLRIEQVAASVFLSADHFTEVFSQTMGRTPRDYLRYLRLERAKSLLASTSLPAAQIAELSGFGEASYFARAFRAATGFTPRRWRLQSALPRSF